MKLSRASSYAIHAICELASGSHKKPLPSHTIAKTCGTPERFLLKVLKPLVDRRILISMKGPNGGYRMAKDAAKTSLLEVVEAVDGPIMPLIPMSAHANKRGQDIDHHLETVAQRSTEIFRKQLSAVSIADLSKTHPGK